MAKGKGLDNANKQVDKLKKSVDKLTSSTKKQGKAEQQANKQRKKLNKTTNKASKEQKKLQKSIDELSKVLGVDAKIIKKVVKDRTELVAKGENIIKNNTKQIEATRILGQIEGKRSKDAVRLINDVFKEEKRLANEKKRAANEAKRNAERERKARERAAAQQKRDAEREIKTQKRLRQQRRKSLEPLHLAVRRAKAVGISFKKGTEVQKQYNIAVKRGGIHLKEFVRELNKMTVAEERALGATNALTKGQKRLNSNFGIGLRNTRNGATAFSVFRSKLLLASFAVGLVSASIGRLIKAYHRQEQAEQRVRAAIISTGRLLKINQKQISAYAREIQKTTGVSDELILESSALLLTFTRVTSSFERAQKVIVDMSKAMGMDLKSATIQVGKALQDPEKGLTALTRVGIQFNEQQKRQIEDFLTLGDVASAQGIILDELETQFGSMAAMLAATGAGEIDAMSAAFGDLQERMGERLAPMVKELVLSMKEFFEQVSAKQIATVMNAGIAIAKAAVSLFVMNKALKGARIGMLMWKKGLKGIISLLNPFKKLSIATKALALIFGIQSFRSRQAKDANVELRESTRILIEEIDNYDVAVKGLLARGGMKDVEKEQEELKKAFKETAEAMDEAMGETQTSVGGPMLDVLYNAESFAALKEGKITVEQFSNVIEGLLEQNMAGSNFDLIKDGVVDFNQASAHMLHNTSDFSDLTPLLNYLAKLREIEETSEDLATSVASVTAALGVQKESLTTEEWQLINQHQDKMAHILAKGIFDASTKAANQVDLYTGTLREKLVEEQRNIIIQENQLRQYDKLNKKIKDAVDAQAEAIIAAKEGVIEAKNKLRVDNQTNDATKKKTDLQAIMNDTTGKSVTLMQIEDKIRLKYSKSLGISEVQLKKLIKAEQDLAKVQKAFSIGERVKALKSESAILEDTTGIYNSMVGIKTELKKLEDEGLLTAQERNDLEEQLIAHKTAGLKRSMAQTTLALKTELDALNKKTIVSERDVEISMRKFELLQQFPEWTAENAREVEALVELESQLLRVKEAQNIAAQNAATLSGMGGTIMNIISPDGVQLGQEIHGIFTQLNALGEESTDESIKLTEQLEEQLRLRVEATLLETRLNTLSGMGLRVNEDGNVQTSKYLNQRRQLNQVVGAEYKMGVKYWQAFGIGVKDTAEYKKIKDGIVESLEAQSAELTKILERLDGSSVAAKRLQAELDRVNALLAEKDGEENAGAGNIASGIIESVQKQNVEMAMNTLATVGQLYGEIAAIQNAAKHREIEASNKAMDNEVANLKNSEKFKRASSRRQDRMLQALERKQEAKRKENWEKSKALRISEAKTAGGVAVLSALATPPWYLGLVQAGIALYKTSEQVKAIQAETYQAEQGGYIVGKRHANGGVPLEVEGGEYIIRRKAVTHYGQAFFDKINNMEFGPLNEMQRGGVTPNTNPTPTAQASIAPVNIYFEGNVMTDEFIEEEAIPKIREAIRRGATI